MADPKLIEEARRILADVTPLAFDCGTLCGHRCCTDFTPDAELGVYLLPGELPLFDGTEDWINWTFHSTQEYDFAPSWGHHGQIPFMMCHKLCNREKRPFECRTYPLVPYLAEDGGLEMRYAPWAEGVCPLTERYRIDQLEPAFVKAARQAWRVLLADPEMLDHVRWVTAQLKDWETLPHIDLEEEEG